MSAKASTNAPPKYNFDAVGWQPSQLGPHAAAPGGFSSFEANVTVETATCPSEKRGPMLDELEATATVGADREQENRCMQLLDRGSGCPAECLYGLHSVNEAWFDHPPLHFSIPALTTGWNQSATQSAGLWGIRADASEGGAS